MKLLLPAARGDASPSPVSPLEADLAGPHGDAARAKALQDLEALESRVRIQLTKGVPPREYARWLAVQQACQAAREVLTMVRTTP